MIRIIHRAKFVLAESDLLLQNAAIHVSGPGRVSRIQPWHGSATHLQAEVTDWGNAVILPDNINSRNIEAQIMGGAGECIATIIAGKIAWREYSETGGRNLGIAGAR